MGSFEAKGSSEGELLNFSSSPLSSLSLQQHNRLKLAALVSASLSRLCCRSKIPIRNRRTSSELAENAAKELESLSEYMPNISYIEARTLALRLYYMEVVSEGKSPTNAQNMVMFGMYSDSDSSSLAAFSASSDEVLRFLMGILLRQHNRLKLAALGDPL